MERSRALLFDAGDWGVVGMKTSGFKSGNSEVTICIRVGRRVEPELREKLERSIHEERVLESIRRVTDGGEPLVIE